MFHKLFNIRGTEDLLQLENLEKMLHDSLPEIEPRYGYEGNLRRRLSDYSNTVPVHYSKHHDRYSPTTNDMLLMMIGLLSGAAVLVMGVRVAIFTLAGLGLLRNMRRELQTSRWNSPRPVG